MTQAIDGDAVSIADRLSRIKKHIVELNAETDQLNTTIERIEKGLLGSGVPFWWVDGPKLCFDRVVDERN